MLGVTGSIARTWMSPPSGPLLVHTLTPAPATLTLLTQHKAVRRIQRWIKGMPSRQAQAGLTRRSPAIAPLAWPRGAPGPDVVRCFREAVIAHLLIVRPSEIWPTYPTGRRRGSLVPRAPSW